LQHSFSAAVIAWAGVTQFSSGAPKSTNASSPVPNLRNVITESSLRKLLILCKKSPPDHRLSGLPARLIWPLYVKVRTSLGSGYMLSGFFWYMRRAFDGFR
jgi:hypothetical protein